MAGKPRITVFGLVAILAISLLAALTPAAANEITSEDIADAKRDMNWQTCYQDYTAQTGFLVECASIRAPLTYERPFGSTVEIQMVRLPAQDQENRRGAILLNPGGPGGSGIEFALGFGPAAGIFLGPEVPMYFDLVGFDPRGINFSSPVRCFANLDRAFETAPPTAFPLTTIEEMQFEESANDLARACRRRGQARRVGSNVSTTNVAKDMDLIRAMMGDEYLNFLGLSYGTYVGQVYANLFPDKARAIVIDGVLDPLAWVNEEAEVPFSTRLRSDKGAADTLDEFFRQCDAAQPGNCPLAPNSAERYQAVADALLAGPVPFTDPFSGEQFLLTYQDFIGFSLGALYNPFAFIELAFLTASLEGALAAPGAPALLGAQLATVEAPFEAERYMNFVEGFPAVGCVDTSNPTALEAWSEAGAAAELEPDLVYPYFSRLWTWAPAPCLKWPFVDRNRYEGPFDTETANPVLIIGNLYDPATRYEGAQIARDLLPNSGLLTVDVAAHTSLGASFCAGFVTGQYFLDPTFAYAADGLFCPSEFNSFDIVAGPPPGGGGGGAGLMAPVRDLIMDETALAPPEVLRTPIGG